MTTAIYARVSTRSQDTETQVYELEEVAKRSGWEISHKFIDHGVSGSKGRSERDGLNDLLTAVTQRKVDRVMVWSVDRLGRSLKDLVMTMEEIRNAGADLYLHQQGIDTGSVTGRLMFSFFGIMAEFEREMIRERVLSGLEKAKRKGVKLGRPSHAPIVAKQVAQLRQQGLSQVKIAKRLKISQPAVSRMLKAA